MRSIIAITTMLALIPTLAAAQGSGRPRSAASIECSRQADAKGLHGKARKKFRRECKRDMRGR
jgi:psiF repeat-containing protein